MSAKKTVTDLLMAYPSKKRQIEQLRSELQNLPKISEDEVIRSLSLGSSLNLGSSVNSGCV